MPSRYTPLMTQNSLWVAGDIDGFFGLFIDNLLQLMLIAVLCHTVAGLPADFITHTILPGAALSILLGNLFYSWQGMKLARQTGRRDVTALPYGINTVSLLAFVLLIMGPIYQETKNTTLVWQAGLFACLMSGLLEIAGAFFGDWLRRNTPRAALLSCLAGIALTFISMGFIFQIFASPLLALLPMMLILTAYAGKIRLPLGLPGGFVAVLIGVALAWGLRLFHLPYFHPETTPYQFGLHLPSPHPKDLFALFTTSWGWRHMAVIFPMALFNLIGSLQNLESAEAAGDAYPTRPSLLANGALSVVAAFLGSPFPTTIYIGHPAWKAMGARTGYSVLNGVVITGLCLFGGVTLVLKVVPLEATLGILLWIGLVMSAQAFQEVPKEHALAVVLGFIPSLASWALLLIETSLRVAGSSLFASAPQFGNQLYIGGIISLSQGFMLSSMALSAILVYVIERRFLKAAAWALAASALSMTGLIHAYSLGESGVQNKFGWKAAPEFALMYAASALLFWLLRRKSLPKTEVHVDA
ncbi:MAG: NCS2 family permease [bacterium]